MKNLMWVATLFSCFMLLKGCVSDQNSYVFRYSHSQPMQHPRSMSMIFFKEELEKRTEGKIIWDIPNTPYCTEIPYPDAYEEIKDYLAHIHIKDCVSNISRATVRFCPLGEGDMAPYLENIAGALKRDGYEGVVSLESVYRPDNGTFENGYRECLPMFKKLFG